MPTFLVSTQPEAAESGGIAHDVAPEAADDREPWFGPYSHRPQRPPRKLISRSQALTLDAAAASRIIEMAWQDRIPFEAIAFEFGLGEPAVIALMRAHMKPSSFRMWRKRVCARSTKHGAKFEARAQLIRV